MASTDEAAGALLTRPALLRRLAMIEDRPGGVRQTLYIPPGHLEEAAERASWLPLVARRSQTGLVLLHGDRQGTAISPPFPVETLSEASGPDLGPLRELLERRRVVGIILLRLGAYAAGIADNGRLYTTKVGTRYVKGRHRAGGQSQRRFERNREKWVRELYDEACEAWRSRLAEWGGPVDHLALGGDRHILRQFTDRCEALAPLLERRLARQVPVDRPNRGALDAACAAVWSSSLHTVEYGG